MPVGFWALDWQSANLNYDILRLLTEEVLGYQTEETGRSIIVVSGLWAIAGCRVPVALEREAMEQCELDPARAVSTTHLTVETWDFYLPTTLQELDQRHPERQPIKLGGDFGSLGFRGQAANWVPREVWLDGLKDGIVLDHFRSYNDSMFFPAKYFDSIDHINTTEFFRDASRCRDYPPMNQDKDARDYLRHFNDHEGLESYTEDGVTKLRGRCDDGVWWLSPACRRNRTRCIPWITIDGYGYSVIWHKVVEFNMPLALASTTNWVNVIHQNRVLNYAWIPDAQFVNRNLMQVLFPGYSKEQHDQSLFITEFAQVVTEKWAHRGIEQAAPRLWATASSMNLTRTKMQEVLEDRELTGKTSREAACHFLRNNEEIWRGWIPDVTSCFDGQGLVEEGGERKCDWCPRATASRPHRRIPGSRECIPCPKGTYQPLAMQNDCLPCEEGTYADRNGSETCSLCEQGKFTDQTASSECRTCPPMRTTKVEGARSVSFCFCQEGHYEPSGLGPDDYTCEVCAEQLECPVDSRMSVWTQALSGNWTGSTADIYPRVAPAFYADAADPQKVFKCRSEEECPGGAFNTCGPNRGIPPEKVSDSTGLVCAKCLQGYHQSFGGDCIKCQTFELGYFLMPTLQILFAPVLCVIIYMLSKDPFTSEYMDAPPRKINVLVSIVLVQMQTVGIIRSMNLQVPDAAKQAWEFGDYMNQPLSVLRPECAGGGAMGDFQVQYIIRSLQPLAVCLFFFLTYCVSRLIARYVFRGGKEDAAPKRGLGLALRTGMQGPQTFNACGSVLFTFCIAVFQLAFELFQCYSHPTGDMSSMVKAPEVMCHSSMWTALVGVGASAVILYGVLPQCVFCYVLYIGPSYFHSRTFRSTWKFLIMKWKPSVWWWSIPFLIKGFFVSMTNVIFQSANFQVLWVACIQLLYLYFLMLFTPWRHMEGQRSDSFVTFCMVCATMCCFIWAEQLYVDEAEAFGNIALPFCFIPMVLIVFQMIYLMRSSLKFTMGDHTPALIQGIHDTFKIYRQIEVLSEASVLDLVQATVHSTPRDRQELSNALAAYISEVVLTHRGSGVGSLPKQPLMRLVQRRASPWLREQLVASGQPLSTGDRMFKQMLINGVDENDIFDEREVLSIEEFTEAWTRHGGGSCTGYAVDLLDPYGNHVITRAAFATLVEHVSDLRMFRRTAASVRPDMGLGGGEAASAEPGEAPRGTVATASFTYVNV